MLKSVSRSDIKGGTDHVFLRKEDIYLVIRPVALIRKPKVINTAISGSESQALDPWLVRFFWIDMNASCVASHIEYNLYSYFVPDAEITVLGPAAHNQSFYGEGYYIDERSRLPLPRHARGHKVL